MHWAFRFLLVVSCLPTPVWAAGLARNDTFSVYTSGDDEQALAEQILAQAEKFRREIAREWLGVELPAGVGSTIITVTIANDRDSGLTWAKDHPDRRSHTVYLTTSRERAAGATLRHELAHVVLATQFSHPNRLPTFLEEGIASSYDDPARHEIRRQHLSWFAQSGNWPRLERVLHRENISADDKESYTAVSSLIEFLLTKKDKPTLIQFGRSVQQVGLERALQRHYDLRDATELQSAWQNWVQRSQRIVATPVGFRK